MKKSKSLNLCFWITFALGLAFSGCGGKIPEIHHDASLKGSKVVYSPNLNSENTVDVGMNMFSKSYMYNDEDTYTVTLLDDAYMKVFGTEFVLQAQYKGLLSKWEGHNVMCYYPNPITYHCLTDGENTGSFTFHGAGMLPKQYKFEKPIQYKIEPNIVNIIASDSFKYEVLYQGKADNKIKISFREFKNDMARPAFTQDIEYPLDKDGGTLVGFKGLRIKVIKASNIDITYSVIQDYN